MTIVKHMAGIVAIAIVLAAGAAQAGTTTYKYDVLGRIIEIDYPDGTKVYYAYDSAGNRSQVSHGT